MFSANWLFYLLYYSSLFYTHSLFRPVPRIQEICSHLPIIDQAISQAKPFLPFISMFVNSVHSFMFDSSITYTIKPFLISQLNSIIVTAFSICYLGLLLFIIVFFTQYLLRIFYVSSIAVRYGIKDGKKNILSLPSRCLQSDGETDMRTNITSCWKGSGSIEQQMLLYE